MQVHYAQIRFIAANYSKLQGLREVPVGLFVTTVAVWSVEHQGDLGIPILFALGAALLYWLIDRFYINRFGRIRQTSRTRSWELIASILFGVLALLAFWLDTARDLPFSVLGLVVAAELFEDFWRATQSIKGRSFGLYPENLIAACLIFVLSLLPLTGLAWLDSLKLPSQFLGMITVIVIFLILAGIWGHIRLLRILPAREAKPDENAL